MTVRWPAPAGLPTSSARLPIEGLWPFVLARAACSNSRLNPEDWYPSAGQVAS